MKRAAAAGLILSLATSTLRGAPPLDLTQLRNPAWVAKDNLRDPSVYAEKDGYQLFYSRFSVAAESWNAANNWTIGHVLTRDFVHFEADHDVSPIGYASPGDLVFWGGRYVLPYQRYPSKPVELCFSESSDRKAWSPPRPFLTEASQLKWNKERRVIDPTLVVDGNTLHCFFVGSAGMPDGAGKSVHTNLLGHAITRDPLLREWKILTTEQPLIGPSENAPDGVENVMVFKTGETWTMIYSEGLVHQHLARATSLDLVSWTLKGKIDLPTQAWMANRYGAPYVWRNNGGFLMILMGEDVNKRTTFGLLSSPDGEKWTLLPEAKPK